MKVLHQFTTWVQTRRLVLFCLKKRIFFFGQREEPRTHIERREIGGQIQEKGVWRSGL